jgi:hypothetical protein
MSAALVVSFVLGASAAAQIDDDLTFRFRDETAPAGGTVQMKLEDSDGSPISGGRPFFAFDGAMFDAVEGIGLFARSGEAAGAAVIAGNRVTIAYATTTSLTGDDFPIMTVALRIRQDASRGRRTRFTLNPLSVWNVGGEVVRPRVSSGEVTVGGSVSTGSVFPATAGFQPERLSRFAERDSTTGRGSGSKMSPSAT